MFRPLVLGIDLSNVLIKAELPSGVTFSGTTIIAYGQTTGHRIEQQVLYGVSMVKVIIPGKEWILYNGAFPGEENHSFAVPASFGVISYLNEEAYSYPYIFRQVEEKVYGIDEDKNLVGITFDGAGFHNSIYRGENLGDHVTEEQWEEILSGRFGGMYIGDYWLISNVHYRIAAFDYYFGIKYTTYTCKNHHVVIVPDELLSSGKINTSRSETGAYYNSEMRSTTLPALLTTLRSIFGSGDTHILPITQVFVSALTSGRPSAVSAAASERIWLMNEVNVYGTKFTSAKYAPGLETYSNQSAHYTYDNVQFPLFRLNNNLINSSDAYWLRDTSGVYNDTNQYYCDVSGNRSPANSFQDMSLGIRPVFCLHGGDYSA